MNNPHYSGNTQSNPITLPAHTAYPYDDGHVAAVLVTATAEEFGCEFFQNMSSAIACCQKINSETFVHTEELTTGQVISRSWNSNPDGQSGAAEPVDTTAGSNSTAKEMNNKEVEDEEEYY